MHITICALNSHSGAISTGTHGSGLRYGVLASHIEKLRLITSTGEVIIASKDENTDIFNAGV